MALLMKYKVPSLLQSFFIAVLGRAVDAYIDRGGLAVCVHLPKL